ncbi:MAG TPA: FtsX-like permease family protein [Spirochaetia bacterium]|nr:FtsX-like permease family protein [Spirochaetia bacterium]
MSARLAFFLSSRMLRGRDGTSRYLRGSVLGIALSLVPLIVVIEVSTGMIEGITARLLEVGTYHLQCSLPSSTSTEEMQRRAQSIASVPGVVAAVPERQGTGLLVTRRAAAGVSIRCVPSDVFAVDAGFRSHITLRSGTADLSRADSILVSAALAASLHVTAGDAISLLTTFGENLGGAPRLTPLIVSGVYETGYQELDKTLVYGSLALARRSLSPRGSRALIGVKVKDPFGDLSRIAEAVSAAAGRDPRVATWREIEYPRLASFRTTKALLLFIMALVVIVASVNVSSSVLMIVFERRNDIGILKSVGVGERFLSLSFLLTGFATGVLGTAFGLAAGLLISVNINEVIAGLEWIVNEVLRGASLIRSVFLPSAPALGSFTIFNSAYYLTSIPIRIDAGDVLAAGAGTVLLCALASWVPAARASRTRPLSILRKV